MQNLQDKVVVITGAGSGIGRALAQACHARGARLALADVDEAGMAGTVAAMDPQRVLQQRCDVAARAQVEAFRDATLARYGQADVVVNNAGVAVSNTLDAMSYEDFEWIMGINFWGVVHGSKAFLPHLKTRPQASIINISSVFGLIAVPTQGAYNASKFAVRGFTEALRHEMADSPVHVMCVHPGGIRTNIARRQRFHAGLVPGQDAKASADQFEKVARTTPAQAAQKILKDLARRSPRCRIGPDAYLIDWISRLLPESYWGLFRHLLKAA